MVIEIVVPGYTASMSVGVLAVPYDSGSRAVRMGAGPDRLLRHGLPQDLRSAGYNLEVEHVEAPDGFRAEVATSFDLYRRLSRRTNAAVDAGAYPLVLAGNCGSALGTVSGTGSEGIGIIWFDAHGDFATPETSISGFLDGMGLAILAGTCWQPLASTVPGFSPVPARRILHIGARDLDRGEGECMRQAGVTLIESGSIEHAGIHAVLEPALTDLCARVSEVYVHVDADVFDPTVAPANTYQPKGGLTVHQLEEALDAIGRVLCIRAAGVAA